MDCGMGSGAYHESEILVAGGRTQIAGRPIPQSAIRNRHFLPLDFPKHRPLMSQLRFSMPRLVAAIF
jgi:hypothetical protein